MKTRLPTVDEALKLLDRAGMPWRRAPNAMMLDPVYDGQALTIESLQGHDIIHDLAHWLICTPSRRAVENYGLGYDYMGGGTRTPRVSRRFAQREEVATCLVDLALLAKHGWDWRRQAADYSIVDKRTLPATMRTCAESLVFAIRRGVLLPTGRLAPAYQRI